MPGPNLIRLVTGALIHATNASNAILALSESTVPGTHSPLSPEVAACRP